LYGLEWITNLYPLGRSALAFVIRVWIEPRELDDGRIIWRGVVEVVDNTVPDPSGPERPEVPKQHGFTSLKSLVLILANYLVKLGIPLDHL
jgi:hypothetical protein